MVLVPEIKEGRWQFFAIVLRFKMVTNFPNNFQNKDIYS